MKYGAIYIDWPLNFEVWGKDTGKGRSAESHYGTMSEQAIFNTAVASLAKKNCALFVWSTWTHLPFVMNVAKCHGFEYKTCAFLWAKLNKQYKEKKKDAADDANWFFGMGYWTRANTEPCFLFTRGEPKRKKDGANVRQLVISPVQEHSQKPEEIHQRIERLVKGPYIELFARKPYLGWTCLGNEISGNDINVDISATQLPSIPGILTANDFTIDF